jgi:hypothetical protein
MKFTTNNLPADLLKRAQTRDVSAIDHRGYVQCMDEIKSRISAIDFALLVPKAPDAPDNLEKLALNFRKTFELIIMACQAAHTHLIGRKVKEWRIKNIEKLIRRYNEDFYMHPVNATEESIEDKVGVDVLTLSELKAAYNFCGDWLHAKGPYGKPPESATTLAAFRKWRGKIVRLLDGHRVRIDAETFLYCSMNAAGTGRTHVNIFSQVCSIDLLKSGRPAQGSG